MTGDDLRNLGPQERLPRLLFDGADCVHEGDRLIGVQLQVARHACLERRVETAEIAGGGPTERNAIRRARLQRFLETNGSKH
jgi:hypothetical protein